MATGTLFAEPQSAFGFPRPLTEEYKPNVISEFVGLEKQKKMLLNLAKAPRPCALLFQGTSGSGKTTMAYAFAREIHADVWHVGSQDCKLDRLQEVVARCHYVPSQGLNAFHVVIVDEADVMSEVFVEQAR